MVDGTEAIQAHDVCVELGERTVLQGLTVDASFGHITAILGANGAGKTTLLRALAGLIPFQGRIQVAGGSLAALSRAERARTITYVPQRSKLAAAFDVEYVVRQGRFAQQGGAGAEEVESAMARVDVGALRQRRFTELSGGEQRRVLLARALATGARIVLLDEPTASLDVGHALGFFKVARELADSGYAVVAVLHQLQDALDHADRAHLLKEGRLVHSGSPSEVLDANTVHDGFGVAVHERKALGFSLPEDA